MQGLLARVLQLCGADSGTCDDRGNELVVFAQFACLAVGGGYCLSHQARIVQRNGCWVGGQAG